MEFPYVNWIFLFTYRNKTVQRLSCMRESRIKKINQDYLILIEDDVMKIFFSFKFFFIIF